MNIQLDRSIDSIIYGNVTAAKILDKHGIDYSSGPGKSLRDACSEANVSADSILREIRKAETHRRPAPPDVTALEIDKLTRFIEKYHHLYTYETIIFIRNSVGRLVRRHGKQFHELDKINRVFLEMTSHLTVHMRHEEFILFPYIRKMVKEKNQSCSNLFKSLQKPIADMAADHETETACLKQLDILTHHYTVPIDSDTGFKVTYAALREFESDIHEHLKIENEILFPKAIAMQERMTIGNWNQGERNR